MASRIRWALALGLLAGPLLLAGCATDPPGDVVLTVPYPHSREQASYRGIYLVDALVAGPFEMRDAAGKGLSALEIAYQLEARDTDGTPIFSAFSEYVDGRGAKAAAATRCDSLQGQFFRDPDTCKGRQTLSFTYLEHGLPAALGSSWLWGRAIDGSPLDAHWTLFGDTFPARYDVTLQVETGRRCAHLRTDADLPSMRDARSAALASPPVELTVCDDSAWPLRMLDAAGREWQRQSRSPGEGPIPWDRLGVAVDPMALGPHARATGLERGVPRGAEEAPSGFSPAEAVRHLRTNDTAGQAFFARHPEAVMEYTASFTDLSAGVAGTDLRREAERVVVFTAASGENITARITKTCLLVHCAYATTGSTEGRSARLVDADAALSLPYAEVLRMVEALGLSVAGDTITFTKTQFDAPVHGPGDRVFYRIWGLPRDPAIPLADWALVDGRTGAVLAFHGPRSAGERLSGLSDPGGAR